MFMKKYLSYLENKNSISLIGDRSINVKDLWLKNQKPFTENEAIDFIQNNCKEFLENPVLITRRITTYSAEDFFYSKAIDRHSLDNLNFYNLIIDNSPLWTGYPKRLKSFCCTLSGVADLGNTTYFVVPIDNSKWGLCNKIDIFLSFKLFTKINWYINDFFDFMYEFIDDKLGIELNDINYDIFKEQIDTVEIMLNENPDLKQIFIERLCYPNEKNMNEMKEKIDKFGLFTTIENLMEPKDNEFDICTLKEMKLKNKGMFGYRRECWTESPCIFVKRNKKSRSFFEKLGIKNFDDELLN